MKGMWRRGRTAAWATGVAVVIAAMLAVPARADEFTDKANALYQTISQGKRSDLILLPALANLAAPPVAVNTSLRAALVTTGSRDWSAAEAWANQPTQRAAIDALKRATADDRSGVFMAFGQPYGIDNVSLDMIRAGLYTELGDPPTLAAADFGFMQALDYLVCLANVEATRLAAAGEVTQALEVLSSLVVLGRQMADRAFFVEVDWGLLTMISGLHRMRDVAYGDLQSSSPKLNAESLQSFIDRLEDRSGFLKIDRIRFPQGEQIAADQLIARTIDSRGRANAAFAPSMARLSTRGRPLRMFSEVSRWEKLAPMHADWFDTTERASRVFRDWYGRWPLTQFDPLLAQPYAFTTLSPVSDSILLAVIPPGMSTLFANRMVLRTEAAGTRTAFAIVAYYHVHRAFPPQIHSIVPRFINPLNDDPFNPALRDRGGKPPLEFFVPIRDTRDQFGPREEPRPHRMNIIVLDGNNFDVSVNQNEFVLYSVGPDGAKNWARNIREDARELYAGDYLVWPPITSLYRRHLMQMGLLP